MKLAAIESFAIGDFMVLVFIVVLVRA